MSYPEIPTYLSSGEAASVEAWAAPVRTLIEHHPDLRSVDLVIEGAIGRGQTMPHVVRAVFPNALYIGTDLARLMFPRPRLDERVSEEALNQIIRANNHPTIPMDGAIIRANCFDQHLLYSIMEQTRTRYPLLVAWRALNAFLNDELNVEEKKARGDKTTVYDIINPKLPYRMQLYLAEASFDELSTEKIFMPHYRNLITEAQNNGWTSFTQDDWLLLAR